MAPAGRKRKARSKKPQAPPDPMAVYDFESDDPEEPSGPQAVQPELKPIPDKQEQKWSSAETVDDELGNEIQKVMEGFGAEFREVLLAKRKKFDMNTKASIKTTNEKIEHIWKSQQEKRHSLHHKYSEHFLTLLREWDLDMQKVQEQEEKLTDMFREQRRNLQKARFIQNQRLNKVKNLYEKFLKSMEDLEKAHELLFIDGRNEVKQEMALLQNNIVTEAQQQELAVIQKSLQSLLF